MAGDLPLSRRALLAGSAMTFLMALPAGTLAHGRRAGLPLLVQVSWGSQEHDTLQRARIVTAIFAALEGSARSAWVHARA
ncbi:hypothetical protein [Erythrobacter colymbi]|uniref:hypothetical protein n=1 Tax=Erythrobacter colymbi TaxID=1161202 RepID=UPI000A3BDB03|nr:hypothetical protein [Erythrobacter colymbi]